MDEASHADKDAVVYLLVVVLGASIPSWTSSPHQRLDRYYYGGFIPFPWSPPSYPQRQQRND